MKLWCRENWFARRPGQEAGSLLGRASPVEVGALLHLERSLAGSRKRGRSGSRRKPQ